MSAGHDAVPRPLTGHRVELSVFVGKRVRGARMVLLLDRLRLRYERDAYGRRERRFVLVTHSSRNLYVVERRPRSAPQCEQHHGANRQSLAAKYTQSISPTPQRRARIKLTCISRHFYFAPEVRDASTGSSSGLARIPLGSTGCLARNSVVARSQNRQDNRGHNSSQLRQYR